VKISFVGANRTLPAMNDTLIGYARCSTDKQDLTAQRERLRELGVTEKRIYLDHGLTGTNRKRPGLDQALAAVREGVTLVVPKLDRLARSVPDARDIGDSLAQRGIKLSLGGQVYDPTDPMGKMFFNILATFAEFEVDLLRMRTREGMAVARAKGRLRGKAQAVRQATDRTAAHARHRRLLHRRPRRTFQHRSIHGVPDSPAASHPRRLTHPTCSFAADDTIITGTPI
jgi:DNA invertase Pin-like site-specific DNA recombinase